MFNSEINFSLAIKEFSSALFESKLSLQKYKQYYKTIAQLKKKQKKRGGINEKCAYIDRKANGQKQFD